MINHILCHCCALLVSNDDRSGCEFHDHADIVLNENYVIWTCHEQYDSHDLNICDNCGAEHAEFWWVAEIV